MPLFGLGFIWILWQYVFFNCSDWIFRRQGWEIRNKLWSILMKGWNFNFDFDILVKILWTDYLNWFLFWLFLALHIKISGINYNSIGVSIGTPLGNCDFHAPPWNNMGVSTWYKQPFGGSGSLSPRIQYIMHLTHCSVVQRSFCMQW